MTPPRWHRYALIVPFAAFFLILVIGGLLNRVDARGQFIDDTTGLGVPDATVTFGSRSTITDADGRYAMDNLPRGSSLLVQQRYYGRNSVSADAKELRVTPLTLTLEGQPADTSVGKGVSSGEMVVAPYPKRDVPLLICANNYKTLEITPKGNLQNVDLTFAEGQSCPPLKTPAPTPTPSSTPVPTGSAAPGPSSSGTPSPTPKPSGP